GFTGNWAQRTNGKPLDAHEFLELAARLGLSSVEVPPKYIDSHENTAALANYRDRARELGLAIVLAGPKIDRAAFDQALPQAEALGATTIRCVISGVLCGDR